MANKIRFTSGSNTFTFSRYRTFPIDDPDRVLVPVDYSEGGQLYAYDKGVAEREFRLVFEGLNATDYANVAWWLTTIARGPKNTFSYLDQDNTTHTVRLMDTTNPLRMTDDGVYSGTITLRKEIP